VKPLYDAILVVSFGGPEKPDDVYPFLENVLRGKKVPPERVEEVAEHYFAFGGVSPLNVQNRALVASLVAELNEHGPPLSVYWGNRNWHPLLPEVLQQMADDGIQRALAFVTSPFGCYSSCRQYLEDIEQARQTAGVEAPEVDKLRLYYNHPGFLEPLAQRVAEAMEEVAPERRANARLIFSGHSIPQAMADCCQYQQQLQETCRLVAELVGRPNWDLVYQSRSGPPTQPWLGPDIRDHLRSFDPVGKVRDVVIVPVGFLSEHMEVIYDLDVQVGDLCDELGMEMVRAGCVGNHPRFVRMIRELILERVENGVVRQALGYFGPSPDVCPPGCCVLP
jgi:ferrochelatase